MAIDSDFKERLLEVLEQNNGSKKLTAQRLNITETTLSNWLKERRSPMSESLVNAIEAMGLFFMTSKEMSVANRGCMEVGKEIAQAESNHLAVSKINPITATERDLKEIVEKLKYQLNQKELDLMKANTSVENLKEQVKMLYSLLSGKAKVSFICNNSGDGEANQIHN